MLKEILILEVIFILGVIVLIFLLTRKQKKFNDSKEINEIKKQLSNAIQVEKIPKMQEEQFVGSASSKKYHKLDCKLSRNIKNKEFGDLEFFKKKKYSACGICLKK